MRGLALQGGDPLAAQWVRLLPGVAAVYAVAVRTLMRKRQGNRSLVGEDVDVCARVQRRVEQADLFIQKRKLPLKLARRVHAYLQYQWDTLRGVDESTFFAGLPPVLRSEVLVFLNGALLKGIPRFAEARRTAPALVPAPPRPDPKERSLGQSSRAPERASA